MSQKNCGTGVMKLPKAWDKLPLLYGLMPPWSTKPPHKWGPSLFHVQRL